MGEIVNLRRARKVREKRARDAEAEANRAAFGRTKAERDLGEATVRLENKKLDARRLEKPGSAPK